MCELETNDRNILLKLKSDSDLGFFIGRKGDMIKNIEFLLTRIASKQNSERVGSESPSLLLKPLPIIFFLLSINIAPIGTSLIFSAFFA